MSQILNYLSSGVQVFLQAERDALLGQGLDQPALLLVSVLLQLVSILKTIKCLAFQVGKI